MANIALRSPLCHFPEAVIYSSSSSTSASYLLFTSKVKE